tara:strand:+ start:40 stop:1806 length:1767 start_codon:yes stop_codon:yes gene_type:complete
MNKNQTTLKETFLIAHQNYKKKNYEEAKAICYKILNIDPNHFDSIILLANLSALNRNFKEAKKLFLRANEVQADNLSVLNNLGTTCKELKEIKEAIDYYEKVIQINPDNTAANYNLGLIFQELKKLNEAKNCLEKATEAQPNFALAFFALGNVHVDLRKYENAVNNYQKAIENNPNLKGAYNNLGLVFRVLNDYENAIICYEKVIKIKPDHAGAYHNRALALKELGKFDEAIKSHEMAIKYEPENSAHYFYLSNLKKDIINHDLKTKLVSIMKNKKSTKSNIAYGNFLLAKYEQNIKNYEQELNYLIQGHNCFFDSKKVKFNLKIKYYFDDVHQISEGVKTKNLDKKFKNKIKPILIVGVPRCGSTLVEKIIGSGDKFVPMGEETGILENFINDKILEKQSLNLGDVEDIRNELSDVYKKKGLILEKFNNTFTDKSLNNFFYLNLVREIYPDVKVINCKRDILSSIVSIFQNNLTDLAWTHDLDNIFRYFDNYFKVIKNFEEKRPNFIYNLEFEKLINNPEEESRKLIEYCELPWNKKCLEFYKRKDFISKTASNIQIRQSIYKHSLDKYLPYKKFLNKYGEKYSWFK